MILLWLLDQPTPHHRRSIYRAPRITWEKNSFPFEIFLIPLPAMIKSLLYFLIKHYILKCFIQNKPPSIPPLYTTRLQSEQTSLYTTIIYYKASIRTNLPLYHHYILQGFNQNKPPSIPPLYTTRLQSEQASLYTTIIYYKASSEQTSLYTTRVSFRGGGGSIRPPPPPRLTLAPPPLGTGRFVNDNSSLVYG